MAKKDELFQKFPLQAKLKIVKMHLEEDRSAHTLTGEFDVTTDTIYT
jgi:hypothetical protein